MDSRRVSLPAVTIHSPRPSYLSPTHLSPAASGMMHARRSLPSTPTPGGGRRSLPGTPRTVSPRRRPLPLVDEHLPTTSRASSRSKLRFRYSKREDSSSSSSQRDQLEMTPKDGNMLRSFDLRHGEIVDRGYQTKKPIQPVLCKPGDGRRATCPEIWLLPESSKSPRHVVMRVYGNKNSGKKTLVRQLYHLATTTNPDTVDVNDNDEGKTKSLHFLLNGEELELEILMESALENAPFEPSLIIYLIVYSVDSRESFAVASALLDRIGRARGSTILIGNKMDLKRNQAVSTIEGKSLAKIYKSAFVEVSALLSMNVEDCWSEVLKHIQNPIVPSQEKTWYEKIVSRGRHIAKSCEEIVQKIIS
ncbi:unnamed protein product [Caenorhabditis auriculariae]|uniref:Uncharacterized protein n=1 Tax=Caenorhabditis auriculariae TaxID=2777116 RepID=A0A8S1HA28_9PELO|nr:unnamed protein product [Caenorhabditis auriculariae]